MKNLLFIPVFLFVALFLQGCSDNNNYQSDYYLNIGIAISVVDEKGIDLLCQANAGAIDTSQIKIYHVIDGKPVEIYNYLMDNPKGWGYGIFSSDVLKVYGLYCIGLLTSSKIEYDDKSITIIKWNKQESDTIITALDQGYGHTIATKYWINGNEVEWIAPEIRLAKIVKQCDKF